MYSISVCAGFMYVFYAKMSVVVSVHFRFIRNQRKKKNNHGKQMEVLLFAVINESDSAWLNQKFCKNSSI